MRTPKVVPALFVVLLPVLLGNGPCQPGEDEPAVTAGEALEALDEVAVAEQALTLSSGSVEIATDFTIGDAVERAAEEVRSFVARQLPCADITLEGATLSIEYGALPGDCTWRGQRYSGRHTITVVSAAPGETIVEHEWDGLANQVVSVTGSARVTWQAGEEGQAALRRTVVHELEWTRLRDDRRSVGTGDRTQTPLTGGLAEGIRIDGARSWTTADRTWRLDIDGVEARWDDPVPQAGTYYLTTPSERLITLTFARVDADTIGVTVSGGSRSFTFDVSRLGEVTQR